LEFEYTGNGLDATTFAGIDYRPYWNLNQRAIVLKARQMD